MSGDHPEEKTPRRLPVVVRHRHFAPIIAPLPGKLLAHAVEHPLWYGSGLLLIIIGIIAVTITPLWSEYWAEHRFAPKGRLVQRYPITIILPAPLPARGAYRPLKRRLVAPASFSFAPYPPQSHPPTAIPVQPVKKSPFHEIDPGAACCPIFSGSRAFASDVLPLGLRARVRRNRLFLGFFRHYLLTECRLCEKSRLQSGIFQAREERPTIP